MPSNNVTSKREHRRNKPLKEKSEHGAGNAANYIVQYPQIKFVASVTNVPAESSVLQWKAEVREPIAARWFGDVIRVQVEADED